MSHESHQQESGVPPKVEWGTELPRSPQPPFSLVPSFIFFFASLIVLLLSFLLEHREAADVYFPGLARPIPETCVMQRQFKIDCPGCGLTRSFINISHGNFVRAWQMNPAGFLVYLFFVIQVPWHGTQIVRYFRGKQPLQQSVIFPAMIVMLTALMLQWVLKIIW